MFTLLNGDVTGSIALTDLGIVTLGANTSMGPTHRVFTNLGSMTLASPATGDVTIDAATEIQFSAGSVMTGPQTYR